MIRWKSSLPYLALTVTAVIWGSTFVIAKGSLTFITPTILIFYRFLIAFVLLASFKKFNVWKDIKLGLISGSLMWLFYILLAVSLQYIPAANGSFFSVSYVFIVPLLNWWVNKERLTLPNWVALISRGLDDFSVVQCIT